MGFDVLGPLAALDEVQRVADDRRLRRAILPRIATSRGLKIAIADRISAFEEQVVELAPGRSNASSGASASRMRRCAREPSGKQVDDHAAAILFERALRWLSRSISALIGSTTSAPKNCWLGIR